MKIVTDPGHIDPSKIRAYVPHPVDRLLDPLALHVSFTPEILGDDDLTRDFEDQEQRSDNHAGAILARGAMKEDGIRDPNILQDTHVAVEPVANLDVGRLVLLVIVRDRKMKEPLR